MSDTAQVQASSSVAYWRGIPIDTWARHTPSGLAAGVTVGNALSIQHNDPYELRRLAEALNQAAFQLDIELARAHAIADEEVCVFCGGVTRPFVQAGDERLCSACAPQEVAS